MHFNLKYSNDFISDSNNSVAFKFKAAQKQNDNFLNGIFEFKIDGKVMPIQTGVILSDTWQEYRFQLAKGTHSLEWSYRKVNELQVSEDLLAEIEYIEIRGVKQFNGRCQECYDSISNDNRTKCSHCPRDHYLEIDNNVRSCEKCPDDYYSPANSVGYDSCLPSPPCQVEDYTFTLGECVNKTRQLNF